MSNSLPPHGGRINTLIFVLLPPPFSTIGKVVQKSVVKRRWVAGKYRRVREKTG
jgi:hypothetical protein